MADDPSAAGDPEAGRSDLFARIRDLQDDVDSGLSAAQLQEAVRGAVAVVLPGLVSDAMSSAVAGVLPEVVDAVAAQIAMQQTAPDGDGLEARLAALEDALDGVSDRLEALTRDQTATAVASFGDLRAQIAALGEPAPGRDTRDGREEIDALREDLADALDYVRTTLATEVAARAAETQTALRALSGSLGAARPEDAQLILERLDALPHEMPPPDLSSVEAQLAALAAAEPAVDLEPLLTRLDTIERALSDMDVGALHRRLDDLAASVAARPPDGEDLEALHVRFDSLLAAVDTAAEGARDRHAVETERLRAAVADQLAVTATSAAASDALAAQVTSLAEAVSAADAPVSRLSSELDALRASVVEVVEAVALLPQTVDSRVDRIATGVAEQILDVRTDLATTAGETLSVLAGIRDRPLADLSDRLDALSADVGRLADAPPPADHRDRLDAVSEGLAAVDGRIEGVHGRLADLDDRIEALRSDLVDVVDRGQKTLADRSAAAHDEVLARMVEDAESRRLDMSTLRESQESTIARLEQIADHPLLSGALDVGRELGELRTVMTALTDAERDAASAARQEAQRADEAATGRGRELRDQIEALQVQLRAAVDGLPPQIAAWRTDTADDRARLGAALTGLERAREEMAELVERIGDQGTTAAATVRDASLTALEQLRGDSDVVAADLRRDAETARNALEEHARTARQAVIDDVRSAAAAALDDVRAAITAQEHATAAATSEMEQIAHRVQSAGRLVVSYLAERDAALEEVRDRDTVQLLEDVLSALSRKEREKAAGETRGILARRRDGRQAERWRQHQQEQATPDAVDEQELLELLDAPTMRPHPGPHAASAPGPAEGAVEPEAAPEVTEPETPEPVVSGFEATDPAAPGPAPVDPAPAAREGSAAEESSPAEPPAAPAARAPARKAVKKAPAKRAPAKKAAAKKAPAKKSPAKKAPATRTTATKAATKAPAPVTEPSENPAD